MGSNAFLSMAAYGQLAQHIFFYSFVYLVYVFALLFNGLAALGFLGKYFIELIS